MKPLIDGIRLRTLREARGWDKQMLAQRANISPSVVTRLERGSQADLRVSILLALAQTLEVDLAELLLPEPPVQPTTTAELQAAMYAASRLSPDHQRILAALIRAYTHQVSQ